MLSVLWRVSVFVLAGLCCAGAAQAQCRLSVNALNFGSYDVFNTVDTRVNGSLRIECDNAPPVNAQVAMGASASSGSIATRQLRHLTRGDRLNYNIFTTSALSTVWGDGSGGSAVVIRRVTRGLAANIPINARILAGQDVSAGAYVDQLTVTVTP